MEEITLPRADALDVLDALESGMEVCWAVNALSVLAMLEFGAWIINGRLFPDLPEASP